MKSHSVEIAPLDSRCRYWAKICRAEQALPNPVEALRANDLPWGYLLHGQEELMPGDVLFEGEANHHHRTDRGWTYWVAIVLPNGELLRLKSGFSAQKQQLKQQGMSTDLLKGSGDIAAMIRIAHGVRMGLTVSEATEN